MKTYEQIARETGASVEDVRKAMYAVEKIRLVTPHCINERVSVTYDVVWFVNSIRGCGYGLKSDRLAFSCGRGKTREESVIDALTRNPASIA